MIDAQITQEELRVVDMENAIYFAAIVIMDVVDEHIKT